MFVLTEIIDCILLLFSKILSPVLSISLLYYSSFFNAVEKVRQPNIHFQ
jgi:hypothetical protein